MNKKIEKRTPRLSSRKAPRNTTLEIPGRYRRDLLHPELDFLKLGTNVVPLSHVNRYGSVLLGLLMPLFILLVLMHNNPSHSLHTAGAPVWNGSKSRGLHVRRSVS